MSSPPPSPARRRPPVPPEGLDVRTLALLAAMYALLLGNFALYWTAPLPLLVHMAVSVAAIHLAFTIWHEAVHENVSSSRRVNAAVGVLGMFPYMTPYFMQRWIHLRHHTRMNERDDPNFIYTDGPFATILLRYPRALGYAKEVLESDPRSPGERRSDLASVAVVAGIFVVGAVFGVALDLVLLWAIPVGVAKLIMDWYINFLPHAGLPAERHAGTRILDIGWLTPLVLQHNYHAIHHLWPGLPWHRYRAVFADRRDELAADGVPIENRLLGPFRDPRHADAG
ncbi:MAG: fatty acid desaturase [Myxococcota bacterium]